MIINNNMINNQQASYTKRNNKNASFGSGGLYTKIVDKSGEALAPTFKKVAYSKGMQGFADFLNGTKNPFSKLLAFDSIVLSSFYMINTARNKKVEKDQKLPLILNQGLVWGVSTIGTFTIEKALDKKTKQVQEAMRNLYKQVKKTECPENIIKGINLLKTIVIFGTIFRFIAPVVITPVANKLSGAIQEKAKEAKEAKAAQQQNISPATPKVG